MKVAAYQAPFVDGSLTESIALIAEQVRSCESAGVEILCCPEGILGGLADYAARPADSAIHPQQLHAMLAPLASESVATIFGFTELEAGGRLFNSAAVVYQGVVVGLYRKRYPAINRSVYAHGDDLPVFRVGHLTFGIVICRDSTYPELIRLMVNRGAMVVFVPTNNGLPSERFGPEVVEQARQTDVARARENGIWVIRSDVAGQIKGLVSYGSTSIVNPSGLVVHGAKPFEVGLLIAEIETIENRSSQTLQPSSRAQ